MAGLGVRLPFLGTLLLAAGGRGKGGGSCVRAQQTLRTDLGIQRSGTGLQPASPWLWGLGKSLAVSDSVSSFILRRVESQNVHLIKSLAQC